MTLHTQRLSHGHMVPRSQGHMVTGSCWLMTGRSEDSTVHYFLLPQLTGNSLSQICCQLPLDPPHQTAVQATGWWKLSRSVRRRRPTAAVSSQLSRQSLTLPAAAVRPQRHVILNVIHGGRCVQLSTAISVRSSPAAPLAQIKVRTHTDSHKTHKVGRGKMTLREKTKTASPSGGPRQHA